MATFAEQLVGLIKAIKTDITALYGHKDSVANPHGVTKAQVGLGSVDNTSDAGKPVSTTQQAALDAKISATEKGAVGGVATLDAGGKVPAGQLPSSDAVAEGSVNLYFTATRVLATVLAGLSTTTNAVITAGDSVLSALGKLQKQVGDNLDTFGAHTASTANPHAVTKAQVGLGNADNTTDAAKPVSAAQQEALDLKAPLDSPTFSGVAMVPGGAASTAMASLPNATTGFESRAVGSAGTAGAAVATFHRPGNFAAFFGIDTDNKWKVGGWSMGAVAYALYHEGFKPGKGDVGLGSADNTADAAKPVSTAQQAALDSKAPLANPFFSGQAHVSRSRTESSYSSAQFQAYCQAGSTEDFASTAYHVQDAYSAPQMGYHAGLGKFGQFDSSGVAVFTWDVASPIDGLVKSSAGHLTAAVANTDYAPVDSPVFTGPVSLGAFTVAGLPAAPPAGAIAYASNGRKIGESVSSGTGVPVYYSAGAWRVFSTDAVVAA